MRTLRALLAAQSSSRSLGGTGGASSTGASNTCAASETSTVLAVQVLQSKLDQEQKSHRQAVVELEEERRSRAHGERAHRETMAQWQAKLVQQQETLAREKSLRKSLEMAASETESDHRNQVVAMEQAHSRATQDWQRKLIGAAKAIDEERARRLAKEKELEDWKLQHQQQQQHPHQHTPSTVTLTPLLFGTPQRKGRSDSSVGTPCGGSPANMPLLQDRLVRIERERNELVRQHQVERQEYLQKLNETLEEKQSALAQCDALRAQLEGLNQKLDQQQRQQPVEEGEAVAADESEKYKQELSVVEQKYASLVADLTGQVSGVGHIMVCS